MQKFVEQFIEDHTQIDDSVTEDMIAVGHESEFIGVTDLKGFLSGFSLIEGPFNVKDKKPQHLDKVLAFIGDDCHMCIYDCGSFVDHEDASWELRGVELWMPIPDLVK